MVIERRIIFHEHHFQDFYLKQNQPFREKIGYVFKLIRTVERIPQKFLKHIEGSDGLFEIRIEFRGNNFRVFCCFDNDNIVVLFNAFLKKKQKISKQELVLAEKLKFEYFKQKKGKNEKE